MGDDNVIYSRLSGTIVFFFSSRRRHTRCGRDWSSDVCSSDLVHALLEFGEGADRVFDGGADEHVGAVPPGTQLDLLAVNEDELAVAGQRAVRGDEVQRVGFPAAGLAADQHVPL